MTAERCSDLSRAAGESLAATATHAEQWLLVEVPGTWPRDVTAVAASPGPVREAIVDWLGRTPGSRAQFIRRPQRTSGRRLAFVVRASETEQLVRRIELEDPDELVALDLDVAGEPSERPLVLVCGHGTRDQCCALRGTAAFGALAEGLAEEELWLSSHHGGHRFAANVLVLPAGIHLGRVDPDVAPGVVARALAGEIVLSHYRGRTCYEPVVQAAERAVRESTGLVGVFDLRLVEVAGTTVSFEDADGTIHEAAVAEVVGPSVPASCGFEAEPQIELTARLA